jgi:hypothetical protein
MTLVLPVAAIAAIERGRPEIGALIIGAHEVLSRAYGVRPPLAFQLVFEEYRPLERAQALLERTDFETALERGRAMRLQDVVKLVDRLQDGARNKPTVDDMPAR